jgi:predicted amidohydrolase YtcJ
MSKDNENQDADLILYHAYVYPVSSPAIENGAVVIRDGKILQVGNSDELMKIWGEHVHEKKDCEGKFLMPGIIEGHGHFSGLGMNLIQLDLLETTSWQEVVDSVAARAKKMKPGEWIIGRGWHQEKWTTPIDQNVFGYPYNTSLNDVSPNNPVMLKHASGHAIMANKAAMDAASVSKETPDPAGGVIVRDKAGHAIGVFEENAMQIITDSYKEYQSHLTDEERDAQWYKAIDEVQQHCLAYGITTFEDAGSSFEEIRKYDALAKADSLDLRLWVMIHKPLDEIKGHLEGFPIIRSGKDMFTCRSIKTYMDGALGSFGAWLLQPYTDQPETSGQIITPVETVKQIATLCIESGMQMCVHAIGDKANRTVLDIYEEAMKQHPDAKNLRWRIEHAQHIDPADIPRFKELGVIASVQGIHCTSDAPFVEKRLGEERASTGAYPWRSLLDAGAVVANGTDAPVERVNPFPNIYALITRKRADNGQVFYKEQAMTREEALHAYTLASAYAAFEEDIKGSLDAGKWADIVILSQNLLTCPEDSILATHVEMTMVGGKIKYKR